MSFSSCICGDPLDQEPTIPLLLQNNKKEKLGNIRLGGPFITYHQKFHTSSHPPREKSMDQLIQQIIVKNRLPQNSANRPPQPQIIQNHPVIKRSQQQPKLSQPTVSAPYPPFRRASLRGDENGNSNDNQMDVRRNLDKNLNTIFQQIRERKQRKHYPNAAVQKLSHELVAQYINIIYKDYNIPDPMGQVTHKTQKQDLTQTLKAIHKRNEEGRNTNSANRRAVQLKQSFLIDMFSPSENMYHDQSPNQHKNYNGEEGDTQQYSSQSRKYGSSYKRTQKGGRLTQILQNEDEIAVKDRYRYCFICEQPILQCNISSHQRQKCPQFSSLYSLTLQQMHEALVRKIQKLQKETYQFLISLYDAKSGQPKVIKQFQHLHNQTHMYLNLLSEKMQGRQVSKAEIKHHYGTLIDCYETSYFKLYENIRKIQWFVIMLKNLEERYGIQLKKGGESFS